MSKEPRQCRLTGSLTVRLLCSSPCMSVCVKNKYRKHIMCVFVEYTIVHVIVICAKFTFMMEYRKCLEVIRVLLVSGLTLHLVHELCVCVMCV